MRRSMLFLLSLVLLFSSSCDNTADIYPHNSDWSFEIGQGYEVWHINSDTIVFGKKDGQYTLSTIVASYVSAFRYNEDYALVERLPEGRGSETKEYYIVDLMHGTVFGPLCESALETELSSHNIGVMCEWIYTSPQPEGSTLS